jgi:uncharacterized damage-inducible protein DinB
MDRSAYLAAVPVSGRRGQDDAMTDIDAARSILTDAFDRIAEQVQTVTADLADADAVWRPDPDANSVAWLIWHLSRVQDDHIADLAGTEQVWTRDGWFDRFGLPFDRGAHGYGQSSAEVAKVGTPAVDLAAYHRAVRTATQRYLDALTAEELARVVDTHWDPPVTAAMRIVSVINDCTDHVGQAEYVRGMAQRR